MAKVNKLILLAFLALASVPSATNAAQLWPFGWWPGHWDWVNYKHFNNHLETGKDTQNQQWSEEDWYVQDWLAQNKDNLSLIEGFFKSDVFRKLDEDDGVPVLIVGTSFYHLGGLDKRRVLTTLDEVYGITAAPENRVIVLKDWHTKREIGLFTREGLQLE